MDLSERSLLPGIPKVIKQMLSPGLLLLSLVFLEHVGQDSDLLLELLNWPLEGIFSELSAFF